MTVISNTRRKSCPIGSVSWRDPIHRRVLTAKNTIDPHARYDPNCQP